MLTSPVKLREDDVLRLVVGGPRGEHDVVDDVLVLGQVQQEVVGDGRLAGASGAHEQHGQAGGHELGEEVTLALGVYCVDDQFIHLVGVVDGI